MTTEEGLIGLGGPGDLRSSYVVSYSDESNGKLDVIICGYRFKISNVKDYSFGSGLWLSIKIDTDSKDVGDDDLAVLASLDDGEATSLDAIKLDATKKSCSHFLGLGYTSLEPTTAGITAKLHALDVIDGTRVVAESAKMPTVTESGSFEINPNVNSAVGMAALAVGQNANANANYGAAIGKNVSTNANVDGQTVVGRYSENLSVAAFVVGAGTEEKAKNSFETGGSEGTMVNEALTVSGKVTLNDKLSVAEDATLKKGLHVKGATTVEGGTTINGATTLNDTLSVVTAATFDDGIKIGKYDKIDNNGNEASKTDYKTKIDASGETVLTDVATFKSDSIALLQPTTVKAKLTTSDNVSLSDVATITAEVKENKEKKIEAVEKSFAVDAKASFSKDTTFNSTTTFIGTTTFNGQIDAKKQTIAAGRIEANEINIASAALTADSNKINTTAPTHINADLYVHDSVTDDAELKVTKTGTVSKTQLTANQLTTTGRTCLGNSFDVTTVAISPKTSADVNDIAEVKINAKTTVQNHTLYGVGAQFSDVVKAKNFIIGTSGSTTEVDVGNALSGLSDLKTKFESGTITATSKFACATSGEAIYLNGESAQIKMTGKNATINMGGSNSSISVAKLSVTSTDKEALVVGQKSSGTNTSNGADDLVHVYGRITANRYNATSDRRLKENLREYEPKKSILELPIYEYDYINGGKDAIGCMAQDLQEICPEIVSEGSDGYLSIEESKIVYLLLQEVKRLREEVDELKRR